MKLRHFFILVLIPFFLQLPSFAADYLYKKLDSGQVVIVYEMKDNPIVTINTWVKTGSINEDETNSGAAHFLEHLFFKGSKNVPSGEFDKILESKGALTNAATSKDYTQFYITIPSKDFDLALKLHSDMLLNPLVPRKELEKERKVVLEEIQRGLDNPVNILYNNLFKLIYSNNSNHPYMRPVIGNKGVISTISRDEIMEFYNRWYVPSNMITIVSGDVDKDYVLDAVSKAFNTQYKEFDKPKYPAISEIASPIKIDEKKDAAQGYMAIAFRAPKFADIKDAYALDVLSVIMGGSSSSVLNTELKEKKQLVTSISTSYSQYLDDGLFIITASFEPEKIGLAEKEIYDVIDNLKTGTITKEDVQKAKNMIKTSTLYSRESAANIANELGFFTLYFDNPKMYDDYLKRIDNVSLKDVNRVLDKYIVKQKSATSTVMPDEYVEISNVERAVKIFPDSAKTIESTDFETKYLLDNGAVLIVRKNKQNSIVAINISAKGGSFVENKTGSAYLAAASAKRGTKSFSHDELNAYLDENGIHLGLSAHHDVFSISMQLTEDKLKYGFMILDEVINYPTFSKTEIDKARKNYKDYVNSLSDKPLSLALDEFSGAAYKGYPYSNNNLLTAKVIDEVSRDDITSFYNNVFDAKNIVITVAGNVDDSYLIKEFNKLFEDKGAKKVEIKDFIKESYIPSEPVQKRVANSGRETSWIILGYKTCPVYNVKELAVLRVIDSLMGTGMSSRLFQSLRENKGLAYQVGTQINQYGNDGAFFAYIGTNQKNEQTATDGILSEFNRLKTEFVPQKELSEAKDKLLGNMVISLETNMDRASFLSKYSSYGYDLKFLNTLEEEIKNVSSSDILSFANKYFQKPYIEVIVGK